MKKEIIATTDDAEKARLLRNINGLSAGDRARCGRFGVVECYRAARDEKTGVRKFKTTGATAIANRGNWTYAAIRRAIKAA